LLKGHAKGKYLVLLTCVLLFIAAVDMIPDPPAVNPPGSLVHRILALHVHGRAASPERIRTVVFALPGAVEMDRSPFLPSLDDDIAGHSPLGLVRHAADSSPPYLRLDGRKDIG